MNPGTTHYIAFSPVQVKSYTGNDGTFDIDEKISSHIVGGPSNKNFRKWFKRSKVVDKDGKPLIVYHGTKARIDFSVFRTDEREMGAHFGNKAQAGDFVDPSIVVLGDSATSRYQVPRVYPVYLSIQNPLRLKDEGDFTDRRREVSRDRDGVVRP
jgi:ADP-Ribosyltransferase in polyvalent proteins